MEDSKPDNEKILARFSSIEDRINRVEEVLGISARASMYNINAKSPKAAEPENQTLFEEDSGLELKFGEYGLTWLGNFVLLFGFTLLNQYLINLGFVISSMLFGYAMVCGVFLLAYLIQSYHSYMSFMLRINGYLLLFYFTLRLHFFSQTPLISSKSLALAILLIIVAIQSYFAIRKESQILAWLSLFLALVIALVSNQMHLMLALATLVSAITTFYLIRYFWTNQFIFTLIAVYLVFFLWLIKNPLMGHPLQTLPLNQFGFIYLLLTTAIFSLIPLFKKNDNISEEFINGIIILNGLMFLFNLSFFVFEFFKQNYVGIFTAISVYCLLYSGLLKSYTTRKFALAFFAIYGFVAMSIAIYGLNLLPQAFFLLTIQSLLVVSMALWFRSKIIVIMNSILFGTLLLLYFIILDSTNSVNFAFALVALITARIINWKRSRLEIETDLMRNLYLIIGFFMVLYSLYHALPGKYITLSWTLAALAYFLLSIILKNVKYRFMALGTLVSVALYLILVDLAQIEIIYRIASLLFLSLISIGVSIYYSKHIKNKSKKS